MPNKTILIVEDNRDHVDLTLDAFESGGLGSTEIHVARNGQVALDFLFRREGFEDAPTPDLILLDIDTPLVDGFEVLRRLKSDEALRLIPAVMLTSSDAANDVSRCYELGSNSYVTKPIRPEELHDRLVRIPEYWLDVNRPPPER
jgi:CheY-like chemotaxis protein